jgi:hypothetical protein
VAPSKIIGFPPGKLLPVKSVHCQVKIEGGHFKLFCSRTFYSLQLSVKFLHLYDPGNTVWVRKLQNKNYRNAVIESVSDCFWLYRQHSSRAKIVWLASVIFMVTACAPVSLKGARVQSDIRPEQAVDVKRSDLPAQDLLCAGQQDMAAALLKAYGETRVSAGLASTGYLIQIFAGNSGSFTIIATGANGISCIAADGQGWSQTPVAKSPIENRS